MSGIFKCLAFFSATSLIRLVAKRVLAALSLPVVKPYTSKIAVDIVFKNFLSPNFSTMSTTSEICDTETTIVGLITVTKHNDFIHDCT